MEVLIVCAVLFILPVAILIGLLIKEAVRLFKIRGGE